MTENEWSVTNGLNPGANPLNPVCNYYKIKEAKQNSDYVFVIVHGGHENYELPSPRMKQAFCFFVDAGADAVICHHSHCYSGFEIYKGVPIFYGLGNFIFDESSKLNAAWNTGLAIKFKIDSKLEYEIIPFYQCNEIPGIFLMNKIEKESLMFEISKLNQVIINNNILEAEFYKYCTTMKAKYLSYLEPFSLRGMNYLRKLKLIPSCLNQQKKRLMSNLIRCEAHRDVIINILNRRDFQDSKINENQVNFCMY
jgi:poly-gamma-glutamate synthesis protein (capsule biosynthesis protein)